jgi:hypothetical protein
MKNFGSILLFLAASATIISGRALPQGESLEARETLPNTESMASQTSWSMVANKGTAPELSVHPAARKGDKKGSLTLASF